MLEKHQNLNEATFGNKLKGQMASYQGLYNGNIAMQYTYLPKMASGTEELYSHYQYDQLNRLKGAVGVTPNMQTAYQTAYNYDKMGNITHLVRKDNNNIYDEFTYKYDYQGAKHSPFAANKELLHNKLQSVSDAITNAVQGYNDLPGGQTDKNYQYDSIGNLIADEAEEIKTINWDVYGKISEIIRKDGSNHPNLQFKYDATGNRTHKIVIPNNGNPTTVTTYIRDAQGNLLTTYEHEQQITLSTEYTLYGSSRLGTYHQNNILVSATSGDYQRTQNSKYYELTNHLGNVLVVLGDTKYYNVTEQHYTTLTAQAQDYLPFGMVMPNRTYSNPSLVEKYRFGYNTQENTPELHDNHYTAKFWEYDSRIGRRWNVDPITYPWHSSYAVNNNNPILFKDILGLFGSKKEAKQYKKDNDLKGNIKKDEDGLFNIDNRKDGTSFVKDPALEGFFGYQEDGVTKTILVSADKKFKLNENLGAYVDGLEEFAKKGGLNTRSFRKKWIQKPVYDATQHLKNNYNIKIKPSTVTNGVADLYNPISNASKTVAQLVGVLAKR